MYGIHVEVEAVDIESNLVGSVPSEDIVTGDPVIMGLNPNMAFKSVNFLLFCPLKPILFMNSLNSLCLIDMRSPSRKTCPFYYMLYKMENMRMSELKALAREHRLRGYS